MSGAKNSGTNKAVTIPDLSPSRDFATEPRFSDSRPWTSTVISGAFVFCLTLWSSVEDLGFFPVLSSLFACAVWLRTLPVILTSSLLCHPRRRTTRSFIYLAAWLAGTIAGGFVSELQSEVSESRGDRIAAALSAYHEAQNEFPTDLQQLIPEHLEELPVPAMGGLFRGSSFVYERDSDDAYELRFGAQLGYVHVRRHDRGWWTTD